MLSKEDYTTPSPPLPKQPSRNRPGGCFARSPGLLRSPTLLWLLRLVAANPSRQGRIAIGLCIPLAGVQSTTGKCSGCKQSPGGPVPSRQPYRAKEIERSDIGNPRSSPHGRPPGRWCRESLWLPAQLCLLPQPGLLVLTVGGGASAASGMPCTHKPGAGAHGHLGMPPRLPVRGLLKRRMRLRASFRGQGQPSTPDARCTSTLWRAQGC